jgi:ribose transport system permease protein
MIKTRKIPLQQTSVSQIFSVYGGLIFLGLLLIFFSIATPKFFTYSNLILILKQITIIGIIACGMTFVIIGKGIDLSVGSAVAMIGIVVAIFLAERNVSIFFTIVVSLLLGIGVGITNGFLVTIVRIPPFITTLVTLGVFRGLTLLFSGGRFIAGVNVQMPDFAFIGQGNVYGIPAQIFVYIVVIGISYLLLHKTIFGRKIYAIGANEDVAKLSGVNVKATLFGSYIISGLSAAIAAVILTSRTGSATPAMGVGFEFEAIVATVLGGTNLLGGRGSIRAALIGSLIMGMLSNGLVLLGLSYEVQRVILGALFITIVGSQGYSSAQLSR